MRINIPNQITLGRLVLALVFFAMLSFYTPGNADRQWIIPTCFWIFLIAVLTDVLDGFLARTWGQVTSFGRIVDPVVDKVIVCGAFVFLASERFVAPDPADSLQIINISGVRPWMVVLILLRELLVSAIRSYSESHGVDFAADWVGKIKMFVQSASVCVILGVLAWYQDTLRWLATTAIWLTVVVTALSVLGYLRRAWAFMLSAEALGGKSATKKHNEPDSPVGKLSAAATPASEQSGGPAS